MAGSTFRALTTNLPMPSSSPAAREPNGPPLMVGSMGERMLSITLPHVQSWNAWFTWFGNSPEGYRALRDQIDAACRKVGRDPATLERTVAVLVTLPGGEGRPQGSHDKPARGATLRGA